MKSRMKEPVAAIVLVILAAVLFGLNTGFTIFWTHSQISHECQALEDITNVPMSPPANPAANPSRAETFKIYEALLYWRNSDGC